jgi:SAM-dependent methyltransferase
MKPRAQVPADMLESLRPQYEAEKKWHSRLMAEADPNKRVDLYFQAYAEVSAMARRRRGTSRPRGFGAGSLGLLAPWLKNREVLEIGCGYGFALRSFAPIVKRIVGTDIVPEIVEMTRSKLQEEGFSNVEVICQAGQRLEFPDPSFDVVYADNIWEHLHPDDAQEMARHTFRALREGGVLILITVNHRCGPSDISRYFRPLGEPADGLHLFESGYTELNQQLTAIGFTDLKTFLLPASSKLSRSGVMSLASHLPVPIQYKCFLESTWLIRHPLLAYFFSLESVLVIAQKL